MSFTSMLKLKRCFTGLMSGFFLSGGDPISIEGVNMTASIAMLDTRMNILGWKKASSPERL